MSSEQFSDKADLFANEANLVVNHDLRVPGPFAPQIASLTLTSKSNHFDDGFELDLSATFGGDEIRLSGDEGIEISAFFRIKHAEVHLSFANCYPSFGPHYHAYHQSAENSDEWERVEELKTSSASDVSARGGLGIKIAAGGAEATAEARAGGSYGKAKEVTERQKSSRKRPRFIVPTIDRVLIGAPDSNRQLDGVEVANYTGWKVVPKPSSPKSGAVAKLRVKESWIELKAVKFSMNGGAVTSRIKDLINSTSSDEEQKKAFFDFLLRRLVFLGLQDRLEREYVSHPGTLH